MSGQPGNLGGRHRRRPGAAEMLERRRSERDLALRRVMEYANGDAGAIDRLANEVGDLVDVLVPCACWALGVDLRVGWTDTYVEVDRAFEPAWRGFGPTGLLRPDGTSVE